MQENINMNYNTINQMKQSKKERIQELIDIRYKIDKMIEEEKINCK